MPITSKTSKREDWQVCSVLHPSGCLLGSTWFTKWLYGTTALLGPVNNSVLITVSHAEKIPRNASDHSREKQLLKYLSNANREWLLHNMHQIWGTWLDYFVRILLDTSHKPYSSCYTQCITSTVKPVLTDHCHESPPAWKTRYSWQKVLHFNVKAGHQKPHVLRGHSFITCGMVLWSSKEIPLCLETL